MLFPFHIEAAAGFDGYGPNVRRNIDVILRVLENPCLGQRLRHPPNARETEWRWDDFCKVDLPHQLRLIYVWDPQAPRITIVAIGPHLAHGQLDNVYEALADMFDLPFDEGHAQLPESACCSEVDPNGGTVSVDDARAQIMRMTKR